MKNTFYLGGKLMIAEQMVKLDFSIKENIRLSLKQTQEEFK
jgi:hypothetical protein